MRAGDAQAYASILFGKLESFFGIHICASNTSRSQQAN